MSFHSVFKLSLCKFGLVLHSRMRAVLTAHKGKVDTSGSPERYFLFKHCVLALCRCWRRIPAATSRAGRALRTFSAVEGCSHVSRVTCHALVHVTSVTLEWSRSFSNSTGQIMGLPEAGSTGIYIQLGSRALAIRYSLCCLLK